MVVCMGIFKIYTDGSCLGNPGAGGYCAIITSKSGDKEKIITGNKEHTTNNEMELFAVVEALRCFDNHRNSKIELFTDSKLIINCVKKKWVKRWIKNGWKNIKGQKVKNAELWLELHNMLLVLDVKFLKVKAHSGHVYNEKCDRLAKKSAGKAQRLVKGV